MDRNKIEITLQHTNFSEKLIQNKSFEVEKMNPSYQDLQKEVIELRRLKQIVYSGKSSEWIFKGLYTGGEIDIITLTGGIYKIYVTYSDTIKTVKDKLQQKIGIPWYQSKLIFGGKRMLNHRKLFHYRVPIGGTVHIVLNVFMKEVNKPLTLTEQKECNDDDFWIEYYIKKMRLHQQFLRQYTS